MAWIAKVAYLCCGRAESIGKMCGHCGDDMMEMVV